MTSEDVKKIANGLIQSYIGPDSRVVDMPSFLRRARASPTSGLSEGWKDRGERGIEFSVLASPSMV